jgi:hypothetical protein
MSGCVPPQFVAGISTDTEQPKHWKARAKLDERVVEIIGGSFETQHLILGHRPAVRLPLTDDLRVYAFDRCVRLVTKSGRRDNSEDADTTRHRFHWESLPTEMVGDPTFPPPATLWPTDFLAHLCQCEQVLAQRGEPATPDEHDQYVH